MSVLQGRWLPLVVLVVSVAALLASVVGVAGGLVSRSGPATMMGTAVSSGERVRGMADAERAAARFAGRWHLHVGETMRFTDNYYVTLIDSVGKPATEVLVEPGSGTVHVEWGPAMMWNTAFGMMPGRTPSGSAAIGPGQAVGIADGWLHRHKPGLRAADPERFPGYYTLHTLRGDRIVGMLSVRAADGAVWCHTWHGRFLQMEERPGAGVR
ncbi:hypothetical protein [Streptomyces sp. NPDC058773]|uniref:hypothetical protein n=1 Tax=Streptomyces sp. NPDC058773 TaxID=3346632 RepID=UPI003693D127